MKNYLKFIIVVVVLLIISIIALFIFASKYTIRDVDIQEYKIMKKQIKRQTKAMQSLSDKKSQEKVGSWPDNDAKYITAMPVDLSQIERISKYRSCSGSEISGYSFDRTVEKDRSMKNFHLHSTSVPIRNVSFPEKDRSMKHYFLPIPKLQGTIDKVKVFAPFNGTVVAIDQEKDEVGGSPKFDNDIEFSTPVDKSISFEFGRIYLISDFKIGDKVKAGELIGYAALGEKFNDFEINLKGSAYIEGANAMVLGSVFDHMTKEILAEFAKRGVTKENIITTKEYRDQNPCNYDTQDKSHPSNKSVSDSWVKLR